MYSYVRVGGDAFRGVRSDLLTQLTGLPAWGRFIVLLLALPGILLVCLSLLLLGASIATLLILTLPAYSLLRRLTGQARRGSDADVPPAAVSRPVRRVEATVIEPGR